MSLLVCRIRRSKEGLVSGVRARFYKLGEEPQPDIEKLEYLTETFYAKVDNVFVGSPYPGVPPERYAIEFLGFIKVDVPGQYKFYVVASDGAQLWLGGQKLIDASRTAQSPMAITDKVHLPRGLNFFRLLYSNRKKYGEIALGWIPPSGEPGVIPPQHLYTSIGEYAFFSNLPEGTEVKLISFDREEELACRTHNGLCMVKIAFKDQPFRALVKVLSARGSVLYASTEPLEIWGGDEYSLECV